MYGPVYVMIINYVWIQLCDNLQLCKGFLCDNIQLCMGQLMSQYTIMYGLAYVTIYIYV